MKAILISVQVFINLTIGDFLNKSKISFGIAVEILIKNNKKIKETKK